MRTNSSRAPVGSFARSNLLERQLQRYRPPFQAAVRTLATRHNRVADLALSFPTRLFALAAPRRGLNPACAIARAIEGASLAEVAAAADVPLWLRKFAPEVLTCPLAKLPDNRFFRRQIANHLPSRKAAPTWLRAVSEAAEVADNAFTVWVAKEIVRDRRGVKLDRLRRVGLWAWFSRQPDTFGHSLIEKCWTPEMQFRSALNAANGWRTTVELHTNLGGEPIADVWLRPALVDGYYFWPLGSAAEIADEAGAMSNCVRTYGDAVVHHRYRLWSMRREGRRVATLGLGFRSSDPMPNVVQLKGIGNSAVPFEVWMAARRWLNGHDLSRFEAKQQMAWNSMPLDRATWTSLWRPYWLAKRRFPVWLPLAPSRRALERL
ncbi:MAG: hypothetical protein HYZ40_02735 [Rhodospirillales bacterium]|nr:hypothetical protein [Rhodospirillales bacterium]